MPSVTEWYFRCFWPLGMPGWLWCCGISREFWCEMHLPPVVDFSELSGDCLALSGAAVSRVYRLSFLIVGLKGCKKPKLWLLPAASLGGHSVVLCIHQVLRRARQRTQYELVPACRCLGVGDQTASTYLTVGCALLDRILVLSLDLGIPLCVLTQYMGWSILAFPTLRLKLLTPLWRCAFIPVKPKRKEVKSRGSLFCL